MDRTAFKDALHAWFVAATGLAAGSVIWADQAAPRPGYPYGVLNIHSSRGLGTDDVTYEHDNGEDAGEDMIPTAAGHRVFTVSCQVLNMSSIQGATLADNKTAQHYLDRARNSLALPSSLTILRASNISYVTTGQIIDLDESIESGWLSRASLDVEFGAVASSVDAGISYINQALVSGDFTGTADPGSHDFADEAFGG